MIINSRYDMPTETQREDMMDEAPIEVVVAVESEDGEEITHEAVELPEFSDNLAEYMEDDALNKLSSELMDTFDGDLMARKDWEKTIEEGLKLLGLTFEEKSEPWPNACSVVHPLLLEAAVRFQAEAILESLPASGPVKVKVIGKETKEKLQSAERVAADMNYVITEVMTEYRPEHERLLFGYSCAGSGFKKIYKDPFSKKPVANYIAAEDFILPYGVTDAWTSPRCTHRQRRTLNDIKKMQASGFYRDVEIVEGAGDKANRVRKGKDYISGEDNALDTRPVILEMHVELNLEGFEDCECPTEEEALDPDFEPEDTGIELPYVVHINADDGVILAIYRNWRDGDETKSKRQHFSDYTYIPGFGAYGIGLIQLLGGYAKSSTSLLRQLIDAGTLSNVPGGLKTRGLRIKGDDAPIEPGEFRDCDVPAGALKDNIMMLPFKEPSQVLAQLLGSVVDDGRRLASMADVNVADMQPNAPMGSTLAVLERSLKNLSAIQTRLHASMRREFLLIRDIIRDECADEYAYDVEAEAGRSARKADYDAVDIFPVSNPNATTMSQKMAQYQAALQLAQGAPQIYDMPVLHRQILNVIGIQNVDKLIPSEDDGKLTDPITENMNLINGKKVKSFMSQDHEAHITVHNTFINDPKTQMMMQNNPNAQMVMAATQAHIAEHFAYEYRRQIELQLGAQLPMFDEDAAPSPDMELSLSRLVVPAAQKLTGKNQAEAAMQQQMEQMQDPVVQMQQQELALQQQKEQREDMKAQEKATIDREKLALEQQKQEAREIESMLDLEQSEKDRLSRESIARAQIGATLAVAAEQSESDKALAGVKVGAELVKQAFSQPKGSTE